MAFQCNLEKTLSFLGLYKHAKKAKAFGANKTKTEKLLVVMGWGEENTVLEPFSFLSLALFPILFDICNQSLSTFALVIIPLL